MRQFLDSSGKIKLLISNLVYGEPYTEIFLNLHLKSIYENLIYLYISKDSHYLVYTDNNNINKIKNHPVFIEVSKFLKFSFIHLTGNFGYQERYIMQGIQLRHTASIALNENYIIHQTCSDLYYGPSFFKNGLSVMLENNNDAILYENIRSTYETLGSYLTNGSYTTDDLYELSISNLHPLWLAANWDNPFFTKIPYHIIWTSKDQIICRGFSLSAAFIKPFEWMKISGGSNDINISSRISNSYQINDWSQMPSVELGQLHSFYPPFSIYRSNKFSIAQWAVKNIPALNFSNLTKYTIFKKNATPINEELVTYSNNICNDIIKEIRNLN